MRSRTCFGESRPNQPSREIRMLILIVTLFGFIVSSAWGQVSIPTLGTPYTQDFDTLANTGTSSVVPAGWAFLETGTNANTTYTAGTGSGNTGDTYSFGASGSTERAFGGLLSGSLTPTNGASFLNDTGTTITNLIISYTGESGVSVRPTDRSDRFPVQSGCDRPEQRDVDGLRCPGFRHSEYHGSYRGRDGNHATNRTAITYKITGLNIANGVTFWIRWSDLQPLRRRRWPGGGRFQPDRHAGE